MNSEYKKLNPVGKRVVVKPIEAAEVSAGGIAMTHNSNAASGKVRGTIVEASPDSDYKDRIGQQVLWRRYAMDELKYINDQGEQVVYLLDDSELLCFPE